MSRDPIARIRDPGRARTPGNYDYNGALLGQVLQPVRGERRDFLTPTERLTVMPRYKIPVSVECERGRGREETSMPVSKSKRRRDGRKTWSRGPRPSEAAEFLINSTVHQSRLRQPFRQT